MKNLTDAAVDRSMIECDSHTTLNEAIADFFRATGHDYVPDRRFKEDYSYLSMNITPIGTGILNPPEVPW